MLVKKDSQNLMHTPNVPLKWTKSLNKIKSEDSMKKVFCKKLLIKNYSPILNAHTKCSS